MCYVTRILLLSRLRSVRGLTTKTYDEPISFCQICGLFNDEAKNIKRNNVMDAIISTSGCKLFLLPYISVLTFFNGYDTLKYSCVKATVVSVRLRILFMRIQSTNMQQSKST